MNNSKHRQYYFDDGKGKFNDSNVKGLSNNSLNCYMNSLLQCLYYIIEFRNYFLSSIFDKSKNLCLALKDIFISLNTKNNKAYVKPNKIKNEISKIDKIFRDGEGADVTDLIDKMFFALFKELEDEISISETIKYETRTYNKKLMYEDASDCVNMKNLINNLFTIFIENEYICERNHKKYSFQNEYSIRFNLEQVGKGKENGEITITDCLKNFELGESIVENCEYCNRSSKLFRKIYRPAKIMIFILDGYLNRNRKFKVEKELDLESFIDDENYEGNKKYKLIGISVHLGSSSTFCGHYINYSLAENGKYYYFNDRYTREVQFSELQNDIPYVLFYQQKTELKIRDKEKDIIKEDTEKFFCKNNIKLNEEKTNKDDILEWTSKINNKELIILILKEKNNLIIRSQIKVFYKNLSIKERKELNEDYVTYQIEFNHLWNESDKNQSVNALKEKYQKFIIDKFFPKKIGGNPRK